MTTYDVTAYKDGDWWTFEVPTLTSPAPSGGRIVAMGQARRADEISTEARNVIEMWTGTSDVDVHVSYTLPDGVDSFIHSAAELEEEGRTALDEAATLRRRAVHALRAEGLSQADMAAILGVSRQRVQQLAS